MVDDDKVQKNFSFSAFMSKQKLFRVSTGCQKDKNTGRQTDRRTDRKTERYFSLGAVSKKKSGQKSDIV